MKTIEDAVIELGLVVRGEPSIRDELNLPVDEVSEKPKSNKNEPDVSDLIIALSDASSLAVDLGLLDRAKEIMSICNNTKAKSEREKVIEAAVKLFGGGNIYDMYNTLYDAGMLVLPPNKSDTED